MEKKILFLDLDGTLLTDSKDITEENLAAIQKATELGHAIVVCTGRPLVSTAKQVEKLGYTVHRSNISACKTDISTCCFLIA